MDTENNKTNESNKFCYNKSIALVILIIYYTWKNNKSAFNNNKFKIFAPTRNDELYLLDGPYSASDIQHCFQYTIKKHETIGKSSPIKIYINRIENPVVFKIKTGYKLELLSKETMILQGRTEQVVAKNKNDENICQN